MLVGVIRNQLQTWISHWGPWELTHQVGPCLIFLCCVTRERICKRSVPRPLSQGSLSQARTCQRQMDDGLAPGPQEVLQRLWTARGWRESSDSALVLVSALHLHSPTCRWAFLLPCSLEDTIPARGLRLERGKAGSHKGVLLILSPYISLSSTQPEVDPTTELFPQGE